MLCDKKRKKQSIGADNYRSRIFVDPACNLGLGEVEFTSGPFDDISQRTRKFLHGNSPQEYSTIRFASIKFAAVLLFGVFRYIYLKKGTVC